MTTDHCRHRIVVHSSFDCSLRNWIQSTKECGIQYFRR